MNFINQVISRIEKGNPIVFGFKYDDFTCMGTRANVVGLTRYEGRWLVEFENHNFLGSSDCMSLKDYMENTKDIK